MDILKPSALATSSSPFMIVNEHLFTSNVSQNEYPDFNLIDVVVTGDLRQVNDIADNVTLSISSPCVVSWLNHSLVDGVPLTISTGGSLPTGIAEDQTYYVVGADEDQFHIATEPGGTPINTSGSQSGTHTARPTVHKVYEALKETAQFQATISGTTLTAGTPVSGEISIGMVLFGTGINVETRITEFISGTGGAGTYRVTPSQSVNSTAFGNQQYTNKDYWLLIGATNRWRMHDYSEKKQTSNIGSISNVYKFKSVVDMIAFLNVSAKTIRVKVVDNVGATTVYDTTKTTESFSSVTGKIERQENVIFDDLPDSYSDTDIEITISVDAGQTVFCGWCVPGKKISFGPTRANARIGLQDFSVKQRDDFGNFSIVERGFSKNMELTDLIENKDISLMFTILSSLKSKPAVYVATTNITSTAILGFFSDLDVVIPYPNHSLVSVDIEGVTQ